MLRRIWLAFKEACTPHPERYDDDTAEQLFIGGTIVSPTEAPVIQAAATKADEANDR